MRRSSTAARYPPAQPPSAPIGSRGRSLSSRSPGGQVRPAAVGLDAPGDQEVAVLDERRHGRGAQSNASGRFGHPVGIVTKSALVLRDLDILARMAQRNLVKVALSVTTLDPKLARVMEPRAATPPRRLDALRQLRAAGVPASVMVAPVIPA